MDPEPSACTMSDSIEFLDQQYLRCALVLTHGIVFCRCDRALKALESSCDGATVSFKRL